MKKLFGLMIIVLMSLPMMAADLTLRAKAGSPGYVDADTIDAASVAAGEAIQVELVLSNIDFTLAGFEGQFQAPTYLSLVDTNAIGGGTPPFTTDLPAFQKLPANAVGEDTADTFANTFGTYRVGVVITDPAQRPTSGEYVLATFSFVLGRDFDTGANARSLATCISSNEIIEFLACSGNANCHIIANEAAENVAVNYSQADLQVNLINSDTADLKGDVGAPAGLTTQDVFSALQCILFGDADTNGNCPLNDDNADQWLRILDCDCSGAVATQDIFAILRRALGQASRKAKTITYENVSGEGVFEFPGEGVASVVSMELAVDGSVNFAKTLQLSDEAVSNGWRVGSNHILSENVFKVILFNSRGEDAPVPSVAIPYSTNGEAMVALLASDAYASSSRATREITKPNRVEIRNNRR